MLDEDVMARYLETGGVPDEDAGALIASRRVFPCWCGAALRLDGVRELLDGIAPNFHRFMFHACQGTEFALATLGNAAGIYGAASLFRSDR